ncbi:isoprenoid biosynthesis glyoxalase ElbB [bacterium]|nr:isoprenoid biosynthesis glyoxalase ElbB [bacterium]
MAKRIGVLLAGSGVKDGSEIHEATLTLLFLDRLGATAHCFAPDAPQADVVDHRTGRQAGESRHMLTEAARIARGDIQPLPADMSVLDGIILPGGFGAAKNLADYAFRGRDADIRPDVQEFILGAHRAGKPIGAICIAPVIVALAFKDQSRRPRLTIGSDPGTAADIEYFGSVHETAAVDGIVADTEMKIVTTPAYMLGPGIADIAAGIEKLVAQVLAWC